MIKDKVIDDSMGYGSGKTVLTFSGAVTILNAHRVFRVTLIATGIVGNSRLKLKSSKVPKMNLQYCLRGVM